MRKTLADIIADKQFGDEIRIWVPACATGEEAYSIGILLSELLGGKMNDYRIQIFATDIDMDAMAVARKGIYSESSLAEVDAETTARYFSKKADLYEIARPIRDMVVFARQDLVLDPPFLRLDLISCRNLLIYFQPLLQTRVLSIFHFALRPSAHLFLGKSESIVHQDNLFAPVSKEARIFKRVSSKDQIIPIPLYSSKEVGVKAPITIAERGQRKQENKLQKALSEIYAPPSLLINKNLDVIEVHGDMQNYLHFPAGKLDMNLAQLLRREWRTEVQTLVHHADMKNTNAVGRIRPIKNNIGHSIKIEVHPVSSRDDQKQFLISFISLATLQDGSHVADEPLANNSELEDELIATREHLQTVIEELETSNEELQALNEEMQAANEELQSSNEELTTVNQELIVKGGELSLVNTELENLQNSTGFSLVLLDQELRLQRYNKEAASVFGFSVHTLGKTISGLVLPVTEVLKTAQLAMSDGIKRQQQTSFSNKHYNVMCFPYTSRDQTLGGVIITFIDETELITAQHEILSHKERLVAVMQNSPMLISIKDPAGRYQFVNKAFESMFEQQQGNIIGKSDTQIFPEPMSAFFEKMHFDVLHRKMRVEAEECLQIGAEPHWFSFICYPINDNQGSVSAVCSQATDITSRKQAAEAIRQSEAQLRLLLDSAAEAIYGIDLHGYCTFCNPSCLRLLGYPKADELIGQNMNRLIHYQHADGSAFPEHENQITQALQSGTNAHEDKEVLWRADGTCFPAEYWSHPQLNDGHAVGAVVTFLDITERKLANEKLLKLSRAVENSPASVVITDTNGIIEYVNRRFIEVTGYSAEEALGQNPRMLKSGIQSPDFYQNMWATVLAGGVWQGELCNRKKSGEIYQESVSISPIHNELGVISHFVAVKEDITKRKQIELELQKAMVATEAANRAKGDFLANMSHEIRTPMNAIIGLSHLCMQTELSAKQKDYLQKVHGSANSLLGIINDILEFSKIEAGMMDVEQVRFELESVMSNLSTMVSAKAEEKGLEFLFETALDVPSLLVGDPLRLGQVLINLVGNAIKFTQQGEVLVLAQVEQETAEHVSLRFTVRDTGIGLTEEQIGKLFHAFAQADATTTRKFGGTGLGLSISKQLVGLMNGKVWVESAPGQGSKFIFTARFGKVADLRPEKFCTPGDSLRGMRVLVVDDNATARHILKSYLKSFSFSVTAVSSGAAALRAVEQASREARPYQLAVIDWIMPKMDGMETARNLHERADGAPKILLLTSFGQNELLRHAEGRLVDGLLNKPFQQSELYDATLEIFGCNEARAKRYAVSALFKPDLVKVICGAHLLLVEDNEINQQVAREFLEKAGVTVEIAENGAEALEAMEHRSFDGVLMDIQMPVMDGLTAAREIRKNPNLVDLPVIAMTANVMASDRERCLAAGMNDYIAKPFDPNQMVAILAKWIAPAQQGLAVKVVAVMPDYSDLPDLPGVRVVEGVRRVGGNVAAYCNILKKFRNSQQYTLANIRIAIAADDWTAAERLAHTLKGLLGTLGATQLQSQAANLEYALQGRLQATVLAQLQPAEARLEQFFVEIDRALLLKVADTEGAVVPAQIDKEALFGLIHRARQQLEQFDSRIDDTVLLINRIVSCDEAQMRVWAAVEQCISRYDYERGLVELIAWAEQMGSAAP